MGVPVPIIESIRIGRVRRLADFVVLVWFIDNTSLQCLDYHMIDGDPANLEVAE